MLLWRPSLTSSRPDCRLEVRRSAALAAETRGLGSLGRGVALAVVGRKIEPRAAHRDEVADLAANLDGHHAVSAIEKGVHRFVSRLAAASLIRSHEPILASALERARGEKKDFSGLLLPGKTLVGLESAPGAAGGPFGLGPLADLFGVKNAGRGGRQPGLQAALVGLEQGQLPHAPHSDAEDLGRLGGRDQLLAFW